MGVNRGERREARGGFPFCVAPAAKKDVTKYCKVRVILDQTYTGSKDCWVVEECGDGESFESLFHGKVETECIDYLEQL